MYGADDKTKSRRKVEEKERESGVLVEKFLVGLKF
jgi:hypothetical protein